MNRVDPAALEAHIAEVIPMSRVTPRHVDEASYLAEVAESQSQLTDDASADEIPAHLLEVPGLVGSIADWITRTAIYPQPLLSLGAALALVGTAAGRKYAGPTKSGTHLYALGLAGTGAGKNHPAKMAKRLMRAADLADMIGPGQFASEPTVYETLAAQPQRLCFMDEFGSYIQKMNNPRGSGHEKAVSGALRIMWGASFDTVSPPVWAKSSGRELKPIISPSLSIFGLSVHEEFYAALQSADVANGFLNRFLILSTHQKPEEADPEDEDVTPELLVSALQWIAARPSNMAQARQIEEGKSAVRLDWDSPEARLIYQGFRKGIVESRAEDAKLLSRVPEMAVRLATIRAIGRPRQQPPGVTVEDITWGCDFAMWSANRLIAEAGSYMAETEHQARTQEVLRYIKAAPRKTLTMTDLNRRLRHKYDGRTIRSLIQSLEDSDQVEVARVTVEGAKKPTDFIRYVGG